MILLSICLVDIIVILVVIHIQKISSLYRLKRNFRYMMLIFLISLNHVELYIDIVDENS